MSVEERIKKLEDEVFRLKYTVRVLQKELSLTAPDWAKDAVLAAEELGLVQSNLGGSYDFYRLLTLMHQLGLLNERG